MGFGQLAWIVANHGALDAPDERRNREFVAKRIPGTVVHVDAGPFAAVLKNQAVFRIRGSAPAAGIEEQDGPEIARPAFDVAEQLPEAGTVVDTQAAPALVAVDSYELHAAVARVPEDRFKLLAEGVSFELGGGVHIARYRVLRGQVRCLRDTVRDPSSGHCHVLPHIPVLPVFLRFDPQGLGR